MAIVQCPNNHYYDDKRNDTCPYCQKQNASSAQEMELNEQLTSYLDVVDESDTQLTEAYGESVSEFEKTIGIVIDETSNFLTAGWLVCVKGFEKGKSYAIHSGRNFAGRSDEMDIVLSGDESIAREKHFSIVYDPKTISFYLVAGSGHTYLNENAISASSEIYDGDCVEAGECKYIFVQYCKEGREWN